MKTTTFLATMAASVYATPTLFPGASTSQSQCPANAAQPDGLLPKGSISTSVLLPISAKKPNKAFAATQWAQVTPNDMCTIFNLELPAAATQGKICNLVFDFPSQLQAPGSFAFQGPGTVKFTGYAIGVGAVVGQTTYQNQPAPGPSPPNPPPVLKPGHSYVVNSAPCGIPAEAGTVTVSGSLCSPDTTFIFKQCGEQCPMGFFVVLTDA
ncbi:ubiquitin 3 binding protein But2 C-terminal domain-containing protein [Pseudomassariella vexata]|uniref:Ubiquitin 3 binding protein But2 C-terminal domain-domain-containing protein n=1 Tax=Pseudomassariella vexata TaxID=1141098 RepID=A0A1Y2DZZ7_9PEZI|nr:ubiquitin 3 binding protein But2 C-terminal domain-containing protein [Pseudomassariella vexata]ORY64853.1 ubiquitin 3 binding protein But2 C-terminal domain-domain-containing protein [Pseudomassariella vexata]